MISRTLLFLIVGLLSLAAIAVTIPVSAQMMDQPYSFRSTDRASVAIYMKNLQLRREEDRRQEALADRLASNGGSGTASSGVSSLSVDDSVTQLVCGGSDGSSSTANASCIILNHGNLTGGVGQGSQGNQSANSGSSIDDVLSALGQN